MAAPPNHIQRQLDAAERQAVALERIADSLEKLVAAQASKVQGEKENE